MHAKHTTNLSAKFQISIPNAVRTVRHWQVGQEFAFIPKGTRVLVVPVPTPEELSGLARGARAEGCRECADRV